jgi:hypothetical protein
LSQGKLFLVETEPVEAVRQVHWKSKSNRIEYYWLCEQCAFELTLSYEKGRGVVTVPRPKLKLRAIAPSPKAAEIAGRISRLAEHST